MPSGAAARKLAGITSKLEHAEDKVRISADIQFCVLPIRICDNTLVFKRKEIEMQDDRKRQARAAWKRRQARKREREAYAENEDGKPIKKQSRVAMISMICNWIKETF